LAEHLVPEIDAEKMTPLQHTLKRLGRRKSPDKSD
jgi:hypothetical protein